jgi:RNA polymerase sporulation-specific sigma factor
LKGVFILAKHKVEITGINTSSIKVLKNDEMNELFVRFQNGDMSAREQLVNGNLKLVLSILKKFNHRTDNMDDLFQIGCIGLLKAIDNFDLSHNVRFSTYAVPMIVGEVKRYLRDNNSIRISRSLKDVAFKPFSIQQPDCRVLVKPGRKPSYP